jgi:hypothetical protein
MAASKKDEYPKMLYRSDDSDNAQPVLNKDGVFYKVVDNAKQEAAAKASGYRTSVYPKK